MWPLVDPARHDGLPGLVEESLNAVRIIRLTRYQDIEIVRNANQTAVEHPVCDARKSNSVGKNVRPARFHRPNMGGIDLRPATTIDELQSRDGASFVIGVKNVPAKQPISNDPRRALHNPVALLLEHERRLSFICKSIDSMRHPRLIQPRQFRLMPMLTAQSAIMPGKGDCRCCLRIVTKGRLTRRPLQEEKDITAPEAA